MKKRYSYSFECFWNCVVLPLFWSIVPFALFGLLILLLSL